MWEHNGQLSRKGGIHLDSYMRNIDKPTASSSATMWAVAWMAILLNLVKCPMLQIADSLSLTFISWVVLLWCNTLCIAVTWNELPGDIKSIRPPPVFKSMLWTKNIYINAHLMGFCSIWYTNTVTNLYCCCFTCQSICILMHLLCVWLYWTVRVF